MTEYKKVFSYLEEYNVIDTLTDWSRKGWNFKKRYLGIGALLEKGEPKEYIYKKIFDARLTPEIREYYKQAGWEVFRMNYVYCIARGTKKSLPIITDVVTLEYIFKERIKQLLYLGFFSLPLTFLSFYLELAKSENFLVETLGWLLYWLPICLFMGALGFYYRLKKYRETLEVD